MRKIFHLLALCAVVLTADSIAAGPVAAQGSSGHKANKPKTYRNVRGRVVEVVQSKKRGGKTALVLDHEEIPNFMRAMRMTLPLRNGADARKVQAGTKIRFDMVLQDGNFVVANVRVLPSQTRLKLAAQ